MAGFLAARDCLRGLPVPVRIGWELRSSASLLEDIRATDNLKILGIGFIVPPIYFYFSTQTMGKKGKYEVNGNGIESKGLLWVS